jgi:hypothetical protein
VDDLRQKIANSWSDTIDDSVARQDWSWKEAYNLQDMTADMIENVGQKLKRMEFEAI